MFSISFDSPVPGLMERESSEKPSSESFSILKKLQEILYSKELQVALHKLGIYSSEDQVDLSVVKDVKSNLSGTKLKRIDKLKVVEEFPEDFTVSDGKNEGDQRDIHTVMNTRKLITDSRNSVSNEVEKMPITNATNGRVYVNSRNGKQIMQSSEVEHLRARLKFLEEENRIMKQDFLEQEEDRKILINDIYHHFRVIYHCLQLEDPEYVERLFDESFVTNPSQDGSARTGLPEVLYEDSSHT